jgi:nucleoside-diphosphate-sugar epimerase
VIRVPNDRQTNRQRGENIWKKVGMNRDLPPPRIPAGHMFFFGIGYTAERLAARLLAHGWRLSGTVRDVGKQGALKARGIDAHLFGPGMPLEDPAGALRQVTHIVSSIPPSRDGDPVLQALAEELRSAASLRWAGYLSTPAVYGDRQGALVRESDTPNPGSDRGHRRLAAERAWIDVFGNTDVAVQIFRLSGIYGPGDRNAIAQVRAGSARIIDKPGQVFNRIHVDDIGSILLASMARPDPGRVYNVADREACPSGDVIRFACTLLNMEPPDPVPFEAADLSAMARSFYAECKRLDTRRLADELGVELAFPTYREGLAAILEDMAGGGSSST